MNYFAVVNTTLSCYITNDNGRMEMYDTNLHCGNNEDGSAICHIHKITIKLDHQKKMCTCACIQQVESDKHVVVVEDAKEISTIAFACNTFKCHIAVHYFPNGIAETENIWPLANWSLQMIQALHYGAVFSVELVVKIPAEIHRKILAHNVLPEGNPFHHQLERLLGESSYTHSTARNVQRFLIKMGLCPVHV
jgi:hypothetical protein